MLIEVVPTLVVFQSTTVWGAGINPLFLRWNSGRSGVAPYVEWAGGLTMMASRVPESTSRFNFTTHAGIGVRVPVGHRRDVLIGYRFHHLSNANTADDNPGINAHMAQIGLSFRR